MSHVKESRAKVFLAELRQSYLPGKKDNVKQIFMKIFFLAALLTLIVSAGYLTHYFLSARKQNNIVKQSRQLWHSASEQPSDDKPDSALIQAMLEENGDFKAWLTVPGTEIDNPVYQAKDNQFYLTHNQKKQKAAGGALFFGAENVITEDQTDKNLLIYGHKMKNGTMFGTLERLRELPFYQEHPTFTLSTLYHTGTYKIYAVFLLNAEKADDDGHIYNIARKSFFNIDDFDSWVAEATERSLLHTGVDVQMTDNIITLVTCAYDFNNARLVVMARETRQGESEQTDTSAATVNPSPRYPKRWYDDRGIDFPF